MVKLCKGRLRCLWKAIAYSGKKEYNRYSLYLRLKGTVSFMLTVRKKELWPGVNLTAIQTDKFKSSMMSVTLLTPLRAETASLNALIPMVLRRGTRRHQTMEQINAALDELYGGVIEPRVCKEGETQGIGFLASVLDDAFALDGAAVLEPGQPA